MKRLPLYFLVILFIFTSCKQQKPKIVLKKNTIADSLSLHDFYKHYSGLIGDDSFQLDLIYCNGNFKGFFSGPSGLPYILSQMDSLYPEMLRFREAILTEKEDSLNISWNVVLKGIL